MSPAHTLVLIKLVHTVVWATTSVPRVADAVISYMLALPGNEDVLSINPTEPSGPPFAPLISDGRAASAPRRAEARWLHRGVLVQSNFGGVLTIAGAPVGQELGQYYLRDELQQQSIVRDRADGSCMIVVATDAPLDARNLKRLVARALLGLGRTGSAASNGSGDYAIAFSTAAQVRIHSQDKSLRHVEVLANDAMSPLFLAAIEATEEAIYNSTLRATTTTGRGHAVEAQPIEKTVEILLKHGAIQ